MIPHNPNLPTIDPRLLVDSDGPHALADLLAQTGYVIQLRMLIDLKHVLRSGKPWLIEGPRGGGKTALGEALALAKGMTVQPATLVVWRNIWQKVSCLDCECFEDLHSGCLSFLLPPNAMKHDATLRETRLSGHVRMLFTVDRYYI